MGTDNRILKILPILIVAWMVACTPVEKGPYADDHFNDLFSVDSNGVTGADGCISIALTSGNSIFMMGDSFLDPVVDGKRDPGAEMIHNSFVVVEQGEREVSYRYQGPVEQPDAFLKPVNGDRNDEWYWPGHGFEHDGILHLFMSKFLGVTTGWGFESNGTDYLRLSLPDLHIISQEDFPYSLINGVHWGHATLEEEPYVYIYGTRHDENYNAWIHVCRSVIDEDENKLTDVQFHTGKGWSSEPSGSGAMQGLEHNAPEQFSVFRYGKTFVLVMQERELNQGKIYSYISNSPWGPWENEKLLYEPTEQLNTEERVYIYNAMAHPQYMNDDMLLVSYCVNSFDMNYVQNNPEIYRPRFFRISMDHIIN